MKELSISMKHSEDKNLWREWRESTQLLIPLNDSNEPLVRENILKNYLLAKKKKKRNI
jgi:hypothetical protein